MLRRGLMGASSSPSWSDTKESVTGARSMTGHVCWRWVSYLVQFAEQPVRLGLLVFAALPQLGQKVVERHVRIDAGALHDLVRDGRHQRARLEAVVAEAGVDAPLGRHVVVDVGRRRAPGRNLRAPVGHGKSKPLQRFQRRFQRHLCGETHTLSSGLYLP